MVAVVQLEKCFCECGIESGCLREKHNLKSLCVIFFFHSYARFSADSGYKRVHLKLQLRKHISTYCLVYSSVISMSVFNFRVSICIYT